MNDLKTLLSDALGLLGCDAAQFSFDAHSPISINFVDIGDLVVVPDGEMTWFWNLLCSEGMDALGMRAERLLAQLAEPAPFMLCGALTLRSEVDSVWVGGVVATEATQSAEAFADAIGTFHGRVRQMKDLPE